jgi:hypothetical protein
MADKPPGFEQFDSLMRKLVKVPPGSLDSSKPFRFVCGPTCGCGKTFDVIPSTEAVCPHCGKSWGILNVTTLQCNHPPEMIAPGPRCPLRWGSAATEVCSGCGAYRQVRDPNGKWWPGPVPADTELD